LAAAQAIRKTLAAEKLDLHDVVAALPKPVNSYHQPSYSPPWREPRRWARWERLRSNEKVLALDAIMGLTLSPWEEQFIASIDEALRGNPYTTLTLKQQAVLNRLLDRAAARHS
jgi:hypothetical protein